LRFASDWLNCGMTVEIPVAQMSVEEKLLAMELLWENLRQDERDVPVPQWHRDLLDEPDKLVAEGNARLEDWETAKAWIADKIREN
jgi:hypothetical protein